jgi:outer membrane protein assembly factor BamB
MRNVRAAKYAAAFASIVILVFLVVLLSSGVPSVGDHALTAAGFINLGPQIIRVVTSEGTVFRDREGNVYHGVYVKGLPGKFVVLSAQTWEVVRTITVPETAAIMSLLTGADGNVYIGTSGSGELYRYVPGSDRLENLGRAIAGERIIYDLTNGPDGKIYGGTYPGGKVFEYDTVAGTFKNIGVAFDGEKYARQLAYDFDQRVLYVGTGTSCKLIRIDPATGEKSGNLLPESYGMMEYPNGIEIIGNKLFIQLNKTGQMIVWDKTTGAVDFTSPGKLDPTVIKSPLAGDRKVYAFSSGDGYLYAYDPDSKKLEQVVRLGGYNGWRAVGFAELPGDPGYSLIAWMGYNGVMRYNLKSGKLSTRSLNITGGAIEIRSIKRGPDGKIYSVGHQGGMGVYDPNTGTTVAGPSISQAEGITSIGDGMYFGTYPNAGVSVLDTAETWGNGNPRLVFRLPVEDMQDRPFAMLGVEEHHKLFVGTVPQYGQQAGEFAVYDTKTRNLQRMRDFVHNQGIITLAYLDGKVYGGTTIWGAYGAPPPTEKEAKLFVWDIASGKKELEIVPVPGKRGVTALLAGPDGKLWGFDEGYLFIFDPKKQEVIYRAEIIPADYSGTTWNDAYLELGNDGNVYGTARGTFFKIDAKTKKVTVIDTEHKFYHLTQDDYGNLYMRSGQQVQELWKYSDPALLVKPIGAELSASSAAPLRPRTTLKVRVQKLLLEKGKSTKNLSGAVIRYVSSRPETASVSEDGTVTGHRAGTADIWAEIELNGIVVKSDKMKVTVEESR